MPINPPSQYVATFDGTDATGRAYSQNSIFNGAGDSLITQPIDLRVVPPSKRGTVYLSFFWQLLGKGEIPESADSLMLMFYRADSLWIPQDLFPDDRSRFSLLGGRDNIGIGSDTVQIFQQIIVPVSGDLFFHDGFKFKFKSFSSLNGIYDTWHIDYVYLNKNREENSTDYLDRTLSNQPSLLFDPYYEIPSEQYLSRSDLYANIQFTTANNLDDTPHPLEFVHNMTNLTTGLSLTSGTLSDFRLSPLEFGRKIYGIAIDESLVTEDSTIIESEFIYKTGDKNLYEEIAPSGDTLFLDVNLRVNDTIRQRYTLYNHYAYDDGVADFAAGVNIIGGELALRFVLNEPDTLTGVKINFPAINPSTEGQALDLTVWSDLEEEGILLKQSYQIVNNSRDKFDEVVFFKPIYVSDTFYIGFKQFSNNYIGVGFDKDNIAGMSSIFFNTDRVWEQNTGLEGSLMIRAVFDKSEDFVLGSKMLNEKVSIYPNPTQGRVTVTGNFDSYQLISFSGQIIKRGSFSRHLDFSRVESGLYMLRLIGKFDTQTRKLLIQN
jgi:hypothetical protein